MPNVENKIQNNKNVSLDTNSNNKIEYIVTNEGEPQNIDNTSLNSKQIVIQPSIWFRLKNKWESTSNKLKLYILLVIFPSIILLLYCLFLASPMYTSETKFALKSVATSGTGSDFASQIFNIPTTSYQEARIIEDYLKSPDIIFAISKDINLLSHYSDTKFDFFSRLEQNPTLDELVSFWRKITLVKVNKDSNVITFSVRAYEPELATQIVANALKQCEKLINSMNERARQDSLVLAQKEIDIARNKFDAAQNRLKEFRNQYQDLDLKTTATGLQGVIINLESQATSLRTQIAESLSYMHEDAPTIRSLRSKLQGVEQQLESEKMKLTSLSKQGESINTLAGLYESLTIDLEFARKQLEYAMTAFEKAKIEVMSQNLYVVDIAKPSIPDESLYPKPFLFSFYLFIALNLILAIISVIFAAIKEHMGI